LNILNEHGWKPSTGAKPKALEAALEVAPGKPLGNSVNGEEKSLNSVLPLVKEYRAAVTGLIMDDDSSHSDPETRLAISEKIVNQAEPMGLQRAVVDGIGKR
jgi:5-methyltetrahydrofolate--homocysteine methyltransferase